MNENIEKTRKAVMKILKVLSDEKWHQWKELLEKTKISSRTLVKHLSRLEKDKFIQSKREKTNMRLVYYKAEPEVVTYTEAETSTEEISQQIEGTLLETKNPMAILRIINNANNFMIMYMIKQLGVEKSFPKSKLRFLMEFWVWESYRVLTWKLIEASWKHMDMLTTLEKGE